MGDFNIHIGRTCHQEYGDDGCIIGLNNFKYQNKINHCSDDGIFLRKLVHELELPIQNGRTAENIHTTIDGINYTYHEKTTDAKTHKIREYFSEIDYIMGNIKFTKDMHIHAKRDISDHCLLETEIEIAIKRTHKQYKTTYKPNIKKMETPQISQIIQNNDSEWITIQKDIIQTLEKLKFRQEIHKICNTGTKKERSKLADEYFHLTLRKAICRICGEKSCGPVWKAYFNGWCEELDALAKECWTVYKKCQKHKRNKSNEEWSRYCKMRTRKKRTQKNKKIEASIKRGLEKREMMRTKDKRLYNLLNEFNHKKMDDDIKALMDKNGKIQTTDEGIKNAQLDQ